jgi:sulfur-carrier protein
MATVIIPTPLRKFTNNTARLEIQADTIAKTVEELTTNFPDLKKHLLDDTGQIRSFVNIFVGNDDIRNLKKGDTVVQSDSVISIVPAIAGGIGNGARICKVHHRILQFQRDVLDLTGLV